MGYQAGGWPFRHKGNDMEKDEIKRAIQAADLWRADHGYKGRGGVVIIYHGMVSSWARELRRPAFYKPGCIAIAEDGFIHKAVGGDNFDGADAWLRVAEPPMDTEITFTIKMKAIEAEAFAQFLKRAGYSDYRQLAADGEDAGCMLLAGEKIREALAETGYAPR